MKKFHATLLSLVTLSLPAAAQTKPAAYSPFVAVKAKRGDLERSIVLSGVVVPEVSEQMSVKWYALIKKIHVDVGDSVKKGQIIAEVETRFLDMQLDYLIATKTLATQALKRAKLAAETLVKQRDRTAALVAKQIAAPSELDKFETATLDAKLAILRAEKDLLGLDQQIGDVRQQKSQANFYAPIDGVVTQILASPKQMIGSAVAYGGAKLARIDQPGHYLIQSDALELQVVHINKGMRCLIHLPGQTTPMEGKITHVSTTSKPSKGEGATVYEVHAQFDSPGKILPREILATVEIPKPLTKPVLYLPWNAVAFDENEKPFVRKKTESEGIWTRVEVKLGLRGPWRAEILDGLSDGDTVRAELW